MTTEGPKVHSIPITATNEDVALADICQAEAIRCGAEADMLRRDANDWEQAAWWLLHPEARAAQTAYFGTPPNVERARTIRAEERRRHAQV